jgi:uncharacterized protein YfiM (DUF2279 family)
MSVIDRPALSQISTPVVISDKWWGRDKLAHITVSLASVAFTNHLLKYEKSLNTADARNGSMGVTFSLGMIKEVYDSHNPGNHFCCKDLAADLAGIALGCALFTLKK